jgi:DNA polymerase zeta
MLEGLNVFPKHVFQVADEEALGLLRWLATSQAAEDINSDDELICDTILSPLLPAATIDKVLEKANIDYESESQKECQDILDSIEDLVNFEVFKEKASHSVDHSPQTSLEKKVPQSDTLRSSPYGSAGSSFKVDSKSECKGYSQDQILLTTDSCISNKQKRNRSLWCSLPFSINQKANDDPEVARSKVVDLHVDESKNYAGTVMTGNEEAKCSDAFVNADKNACEASVLVGCSVRDMMRRKRSRRTAQHGDGSVRVKNVHLGGEQDESNILFPKQLDLHILPNDENDKRVYGPLDFRPSVNNQQTEFLETCAPKAIPHASSSASSMQVVTNPLSADTRREELQCTFTPMKQDAVVSMVDCEINKGKEFDFGGVTSIEPITSTVSSKFDSLPDNYLSKHILLADKRFERTEAADSNCSPALPIDHDMFARDSYKPKYVHQGRSSLQNLYDIPTTHLIGMGMSVDTGLQSENCAANQEGDSGLSILGSSAPEAFKMGGETTDLLGMTFCKKPPTAEWKDGASENVSFSPAPSFLPSSANVENKDRTSGCIFNFLGSTSSFSLFFFSHTKNLYMWSSLKVIH